MSLVTANNPQQSVQGRTKALREPHDQRQMQLLLAAAQTDLANLQAQHNLLCAKIDAISALATTLGASNVTGTVFAGWFPATTVANYGADVPVTQAQLLTGTAFQP